MKVCGRTSRRRMSAARSHTRNLPNPSARLPEQNGPDPTDRQRLPLARRTYFSADRTRTRPGEPGAAPSLQSLRPCDRLLAPPAVVLASRAGNALRPLFSWFETASAASGRPFPDDDHTRAAGKALIVGVSRKPGETDDEDWD